MVHRAEAAEGEVSDEYRVRAFAPVSAEFAAHADGIENFINRVATLGALVGGARFVTCQCLIPERGTDTVAGLFALAIARGRTSMITAHVLAMRKEQASEVETLSAWSDLDFEVADYDHAHLGKGTRYKRGWRMDFYGGVALTLDAVHNNPYWGGGLLALLRMPKETIAGSDESIDANGMNQIGNILGRAPTFGAWCEVGDEFIFAQFVPNFVKALPDLTDQIIGWASMRCIEARYFPDLLGELADRHHQSPTQ